MNFLQNLPRNASPSSGIIGTDDIEQKGQFDPRRNPYDDYGNMNPYYQPPQQQQSPYPNHYPSGEKRSMHTEDYINLGMKVLGLDRMFSPDMRSNDEIYGYDGSRSPQGGFLSNLLNSSRY